MTLILKTKYHGITEIENHRLHWLPVEKAQRQDIRPLRIGIINLMPEGERYEFSLLYPLGLSILQIEPVWIKLESHKYKTWLSDYVQKEYVTFEQSCERDKIDGMIVTGAPVERLEFEEVIYWAELTSIFDTLRKKKVPTLGLCWGGLAMAYMLGIEKVNFKDKLFGVYEMENLDRLNVIMSALDDRFLCPQSRFAGWDEEILHRFVEKSKIKLLSHSKFGGYSIISTPDDNFIAHLGHFEYLTTRLAEEYRRDNGRQELYNFDVDAPINKWRANSTGFFSQWIRYCYQKSSFCF